MAAYMTGIWGFCYPRAAGFVFFLLIVLRGREWKKFIPVLVCFGLGLAAAYFSFPGQPQGDVPQFIAARDKVRISGSIDEVVTRPDKRERIILSRIKIRDGSTEMRLPGRMVVNWYQARRFVLPGREMAFTSRVKPVHSLANQGVWNSEFYWHKQNVFWRSYAVKSKSDVTLSKGADFWAQKRFELIKAVESGIDSLSGVWPEKEIERIKGISLALLFGERFYLENDFVDRVRRASLGHSLALSGMHLGMIVFVGWLVAGAAGSLFPRIYISLPRPKLAFFLAFPLCLLYVWLGQAPHSLVRSGLMFFFWGIFVCFGRSRNLTDALFAALAFILIINPLALFDLSLQLSALAVAGICVFQPTMSAVLNRVPCLFLRPAAFYFLGLLMITLAVNIFLLPVQSWTFGYLSGHLYLNLLWIPLLGMFILPLVFLGLLAGLLFPAAAPFFYWAAGMIINPFADFLAFMDSHHWLDPFLVIRPGWGLMIAYYFFLLLIVCLFCYQRITRTIAVSAVLVLLAAAAPYLRDIPDKSTRLQLMDVGQGQCAFVRSPQGEFTIIDGGGSWNLDYDLGRRVVAPALSWRRCPRAKNCILSHGDIDHMRGLYYPLAHADIGTFWFNGIWPDKLDGKLLFRSLDRGDESVRVLRKGDRVRLGKDLNLNVLYPPGFFRYADNNNNSLVLRLTWKGRGLALIPGDIEKKGMQALLDSGENLKAEVLVLPHHGSKSSFFPEFYRRVNPDLVLASTGFLNYFRMPAKKVVHYFKDRDIPVLNTALCGQINVSWDGPDAGKSLTRVREGSRTALLR